MSASREAVSSFRDEDLIDLFSRRLPDLLERRPDLEPTLFQAFLKAFARREEVALVVTELRALRTEMERRFEQVDARFEQVDARFEQVDARFEQVDARFEQVDARFDRVEAQMEAGFDRLERTIDRLGSRWGIRSESVFRRTIATLLEESFGVGVEQRTIAGEQFDTCPRQRVADPHLPQDWQTFHIIAEALGEQGRVEECAGAPRVPSAAQALRPRQTKVAAQLRTSLLDHRRDAVVAHRADAQAHGSGIAPQGGVGNRVRRLRALVQAARRVQVRSLQ